ncbi:MAG: hypothetical protein ABMA15_13315 [Vicinamibacterales bacterium]
MIEVAWMAGCSLVAWLVASAAGGTEVSAAVFYGMVGPLIVACVSWVVAERIYRRDPPALTGFMTAAFGFKFVFFGAYVAVLLKMVQVPSVPFVVSFSSYFIALHFVEAMFLKRLFSAKAHT